MTPWKARLPNPETKLVAERNDAALEQSARSQFAFHANKPSGPEMSLVIKIMSQRISSNAVIFHGGGLRMQADSARTETFWNCWQTAIARVKLSGPK
jgi:hypothetical protein